MTAGRRSVSNLNSNSFHGPGQRRRFSSPSHRPTTSASFPRMQVPHGSWWQQIIQYIAPHFNQPIGNGMNSSTLYVNPQTASTTTTAASLSAAGASPPGFLQTIGSGLSQSPSSGSAAATRPRLQVIPSVQVQPADTPSGSEDSDSATSQESSTPTEERSNDLFTRRVCTRSQNDGKEGGSSSWFMGPNK